MPFYILIQRYGYGDSHTHQARSSSSAKSRRTIPSFSEPTRLGILQFLKGQSTSVNEIVEALETSQANISKQLRILYDADLLIREQKGNQVFYSIKEEIVFSLCEIICDKLNRNARAGAENHYEI